MPDSKNADIIRLAHDFESITVAGTAIGFTAAKAARANRVLVTVETGEIRFRYDGTDPTATEGHRSKSGDVWEILGTQNIKNFKAIRSNTTSSALKVTFEV